MHYVLAMVQVCVDEEGLGNVFALGLVNNVINAAGVVDRGLTTCIQSVPAASASLLGNKVGARARNGLKRPATKNARPLICP